MAVVKETVGEILSEEAYKQEESTYSIADSTGISRSTVRAILRGNVKDPGFNKIVKIAEHLGVELNELK